MKYLTVKHSGFFVKYCGKKYFNATHSIMLKHLSFIKYHIKQFGFTLIITCNAFEILYHKAF